MGSADGTHFLPDEFRLVELAKSDDRAFETLYDFYFPKIYAFVSRRVGHRQETEDIVSEVFTRAVSALPNFRTDGGVKFGGWLFRVAANLVVDRFRSGARRATVPVEQAEALPSAVTSPSATAEQALAAEAVERILADLPKRDQEILHLKFFAEFETYEIAATLGVSERHVAVILFRALEKASKISRKYVKKD